MLKELKSRNNKEPQPWNMYSKLIAFIVEKFMLKIVSKLPQFSNMLLKLTTFCVLKFLRFKDVNALQP